MDSTTKAEMLLTLHRQGTENITKVCTTAIKGLILYGVFTLISDLLIRSGLIN